MPELNRLLIVGTGALAEAATLALAHADGPLEVVVAGRDPQRARQLATVAGAVATASASAWTTPGHRPRFTARQLRISGTGDGSNLPELLAETQPGLCLCAASLASSWETETTPSSWTSSCRGDGFGLNLALHTVIVSEVAAAVTQASPDTLLINACYPDAVNRILRLRGLPVLAGIGNISTTALSIQHDLGAADQERIRLLAHHRHLYPGLDAQDEALLWVDHTSVDPAPLLTAQRAVPRSQRYPLIGSAFARLATRLRETAGGEAIHDAPNAVWHLPGPAGLVGGYPVHLTPRGELVPLCPPGMSSTTIEHWMHRHGQADGVTVGPGGHITFHGQTRQVLATHAPEFAEGVSATEVETLTSSMLGLRAHLRGRPASSASDAARVPAGTVAARV